MGPTPVGPFLYASELKDGEPTGWRSMIKFTPELEEPPFYEMRQRLSARLAKRDLVRDPDTGHLEILNDVIRGQIMHGEESDLAPSLIVDGEEISWDERSKSLSVHVGTTANS